MLPSYEHTSDYERTKLLKLWFGSLYGKVTFLVTPLLCTVLVLHIYHSTWDGVLFHRFDLFDWLYYLLDVQFFLFLILTTLLKKHSLVSRGYLYAAIGMICLCFLLQNTNSTFRGAA